MRRFIGALVGTLAGAFAAVLAAAPASPAFADDYPSRPIRLVVPTAAGSSPDIIARLLQPSLERALKQPIVIDNRAGASTMIGTEMVAKAPPDGYTLLIVNTTFTVNGALNSTMPFDTEKDFAPISVLVSNPLLFAVNAKLPARTLSEFVAIAKAQAGKLNYGTSGASTQAHLLIEMWSARAGVSLQHIPYRGGGPAALSVSTGETQLVLLSPIGILPQVEAGTVRALASGGLTRDPKLPDLPTIAESGFPGFEAVQWFGLLATGGTPKPVVEKLNAAVTAALRDSDLADKLAAQGMSPAAGTPDQFRELIATEIRNWKDTAQRAGIAPVR